MLAEFPSPPDAPHGGVEDVVRNLASGLGRRADIDLHVISSRQDIARAHSLELSPSVVVHYLPSWGRLELPTFFLIDRLIVRSVLNGLAPDVIHAHDLGRYPCVCIGLGYRYILTVHGITSVEQQVVKRQAGWHTPARQRLIRFVERVSFLRAETILANSSYVVAHVPTARRARTVLIPNPVDPIFFEPPELAPQPGRITFVGRLIRRKAPDVLLRALPLVRRVVPTAHLRLIGPCDDPEYAAELQRLSRAAGPSGSVTFVGERHAARLRAEYASAAVVSLPSREENVPVAIGEAMAVGRPVVATRVGGVADLVTDGTTGRLCAAEDVDALAEVLVEVLADEPRRAQMGLEAQAIARRRFDLERITTAH
ncbi:MAG TPA: glycosyltransferase family 4 protein, partial [Chloroflexota bacterium]|nr:glycosyltransferase family 4 protein [Chloroflexota bacterium]